MTSVTAFEYSLKDIKVDAAALADSGRWRIGKAAVEDAAFTGRANGNVFRLSSPGSDLVLHRVTLRKLPGER